MLRAFSALALIILPLNSLDASLVKGVFEGEVSFVSPSGVVPFGTKFSGTFSYATTFSTAAVGTSGKENHSVLRSMTFRLGTLDYSMPLSGTAAQTIAVSNDLSGSGLDHLQIHSEIEAGTGYVGGYEPYYLEINLIDDSASVFDSTQIPLSFDYGDFSQLTLTILLTNPSSPFIPSETAAISGPIGSLTTTLLTVPEPSSLVALLALAGTLGIHRNRECKDATPGNN
ncbi:PEP-CTERM sorting domain-containing protein [Crateriforma conspicua]|uniref:PEP-CTERM protein-sorting domain-containing protein n=1 Tax=Crateriforma conspicua TaxID=2527996 RepID=A0A5C5YAB9_9PLAN|nr:PEP-CTERM sorting domain-containing protein [Crateriforma conspicua]TWT72646.1 hypothetical protein Pan14r_49660 [Crateriforma conspicua]